MIRGYCDAFGIAISDAELRAEAIEWSQTRGGRSGRVAWQYVTDLAGRRGCGWSERALPGSGGGRAVRTSFVDEPPELGGGGMTGDRPRGSRCLRGAAPRFLTAIARRRRSHWWCAAP